jgi:hypothetical protein
VREFASLVEEKVVKRAQYKNVRHAREGDK